MATFFQGTEVRVIGELATDDQLVLVWPLTDANPCWVSRRDLLTVDSVAEHEGMYTRLNVEIDRPGGPLWTCTCCQPGLVWDSMFLDERDRCPRTSSSSRGAWRSLMSLMEPITA